MANAVHASGRLKLSRISNPALIFVRTMTMPTVGLSMIVKNGADTLRPCLESVRGVVSQIVIADTGSTDDTVKIAHEFGATVISAPWEDHFAKARNAALAPMTTDWVLVLDADEELDGDARHSIPALLQAPDVGGYVTPIRNYMASRFNRGWDRVGVPNDYRHERAQEAPSYILHENCRLFRRHPKIYFSGRIHELVENQIRALRMKLQPASFFIHHFGQLVDHEARTRKRVFYRDLMRRKTEENPEDFAAWTQLGLHEFECFNQPEEALRCFDRALALQPEAPEAWLFRGMVYLNLGRFEEALDAVARDLRTGGTGALREDIRGDALHSLGRFKEARLAYRRAAKFMGHNPILESKLGYTEVKMGQKNSGLAKLRRAAREVPDIYPVHDRLMKGCVMADKLEEAAETLEKYTAIEANPKLFLRAASLRAQLCQWDQSQDLLSRGLQLFPQSPELQRASAEVLNKKLAAAAGSAGSASV
jgi:tetratricopeptide (TPR) repeat protein